jgi:hypothetical protein
MLIINVHYLRLHLLCSLLLLLHFINNMQACMMLEYIHEEIRVDAIVEAHTKKNKELKKKGLPEIEFKLDPPKRPEFLTQAESDRQARLCEYHLHTVC